MKACLGIRHLVFSSWVAEGSGMVSVGGGGGGGQGGGMVSATVGGTLVSLMRAGFIRKLRAHA